MSLAALIICTLVGAAAGAAGYLAALGARRFLQLNLPAYGMAASLAVMGIAASAATLMGWLPSWSALTQETIAVAEVLPYMQAIKENEPLLYERIETSVIRDQLDGVPADRVRANAKALVQSYVADKTKLLPDQLTYELYVLTRDQLAYLGERQEFETCKALALGRTNEDLDGKLSAELVERANSSIARVVATKANAETVKMPAEEFSQFASHAFGEALQTTGIPADEIDAILAGSGDAPKTCKLMKAFFDAVLSQPIGVAASALRSLAAGERAQTR